MSSAQLGLLLLLVSGLAYAAWFRRQRPAWGFLWLLWLAAGGLGIQSGLVGAGLAARQVALTWMLLPWNLLLLALLPRVALRSWATAAVTGLLVLQLAAPLVLGRASGAAIPNINRQLLELLPAGLAGWLAPLEPVLVVVASVLAFSRWQLSHRSGEFALFAMTAALLPATMLLDQRAVFIGLAGVAVFLCLVVDAHRMAFRDALTGLPNRRALEAALRALPARYAVAMADVDRFKSINDRFGHDVGDQVLRRVAARLRSVPRCRAFRYGGEEFCLLFRGGHVAEARRLCEQARQQVADPPMALRSADRPGRRPVRRRRGRDNVAGLKVTISIGLGFPRSGTTPAETIEAADRALYRAKRGGRDKVMVTGKPRRG